MNRHILHRLLIALVACGIFTQSVMAQDVPVGETTEVAAIPEILETPPAEEPPGLFQRIDGVFAFAVDKMATVLFHRLGKSEREYIVFERSAQYSRAQGSSGAYFAVDSSAVEKSEFSEDEVAVLAAQKKLLPGHTIDKSSKVYRLGTIDGKAVEYITLKQSSPDGKVSYGTKFVVLDGGGFQNIRPERDLLGDITLNDETVQAWNEAGYLKSAERGGADTPPYIFAESVGGIPFVVAWLAAGGVFFTLFMRGFNFWGFRHAIDIVRGKYDNPEETGEVTHFQALSSALSATVGLGNIAGVTIAMTLGGPGAFFWMLVCGFFGMCTKFTECTLGQKYRHVNPDGSVLGGPMRYLKAGLDEMKLGVLGTVLSFMFTVMCVLASFGGGNMFQANQAGSAMLSMFQRESLNEISDLKIDIKAAAAENDVATLKTLKEKQATLQAEVDQFQKGFKWVYGVVLAALVGAVIIGGIKRIGAAASKIVPTMCLLYCVACVYIIAMHIGDVPALIGQIFSQAFTGAAMGGGFVGVLVVGVQRAAFSNEAGAGSAAIAHSAAKTEEPIREGCVALLGPFIDTIIVCSMTALVILITGAWDNQEWIVDQELAGVALTSKAFAQELEWFPILLSIAVTLFAYSTIISWSYYGEKAWETLFGARSTPIYKVLAVIAVFVGTVVNLGSVLDFSDMMILGMAFPNIFGVVLLAPKVRKDLAEYWKRYQANEFKTFK